MFGDGRVCAGTTPYLGSELNSVVPVVALSFGDLCSMPAGGGINPRTMYNCTTLVADLVWCSPPVSGTVLPTGWLLAGTPAQVQQLTGAKITSSGT